MPISRTSVRLPDHPAGSHEDRRERPRAAEQGQRLLYNDYALGSRVQYQVRSSDINWLVERLQDDAFDGKSGEDVEIGWRPEDSILVSE